MCCSATYPSLRSRKRRQLTAMNSAAVQLTGGHLLKRVSCDKWHVLRSRNVRWMRHHSCTVTPSRHRISSRPPRLLDVRTGRSVLLRLIVSASRLERNLNDISIQFIYILLQKVFFHFFESLLRLLGLLVGPQKA